MDPITLTILGSLAAAAGPALMVMITGPRVAVSLQPALEACRRELRNKDAAAVVAATVNQKPSPQEVEMVDKLLGSVDWPLRLAAIAAARNEPIGPADVIRLEVVWPLAEKVALTRGEEAVLTELIGKEDYRAYALVLQRLVGWSDQRKAVLGL